MRARWRKTAAAPTPSRRRRAVSAVVSWLLAAVLLLGAAGEAGAQADEAPRAVLVSGPMPKREIPFLSPNIIDYQLGVYEVSESSVEVFYSEGPVFRLPEWGATSCGEDDLAVVSPEAPRILYHALPRGRHVFFRLPGGAEGTEDAAAEDSRAGLDECAFIEPFLARFGFFLRTTEPGSLAPFPAVLPSP